MHVENTEAAVVCGHSGKVKIVIGITALENKNTNEYPGERGQFSLGVNSKKSLQETLEMDCRMESLPFSHLPSVLCNCIHSLQ